MRALFLVSLTLFGLLATTAANADTGIPSWVSEAKVGLLTHDSYTFDDHFLEIWKNRKEPGMDINFEVLMNGPQWFEYVGTPRFQLGGDISTSGATNYAYTGLQWQHDFHSGLFVAGFFGLAIHDGTTDISQKDPNGNITPATTERFQNRKRLGSRVLFHLGPEVGYAFDEHNSLSLMWAHLSNGHILADKDAPNQGIDNIGLRYGYKF